MTAFSLDSTTVTLEDTTTVFVPNGEFAKSVVRNITRRTHWPLKAVLRVPFASLPLCERLCADMEAYCRGRPDFAEAPPRLNCRVVLGELEHFAVPIEVTTFCRSEGVTQAEMERRRSDVVFRCCELAVRAGVPLVAPVMEVGLHPDVAVARGMLPYKRVVEDGSYVDDK